MRKLKPVRFVIKQSTESLDLFKFTSVQFGSFHISGYTFSALFTRNVMILAVQTYFEYTEVHEIYQITFIVFVDYRLQ